MGKYCIAIVVMVGLTGCSGVLYKKSVEKYAESIPERGKIYYDLVDPLLKKELVLNDSALSCLVDKDNGVEVSLACKCSDGLPNDWEKNCADWLK